ncbi:MAG TPA: hypothetical protein VFM54_16685 [Micromonosporaceae bacterium]|nr:hypothetical protein [Micromonosporaceae bacterium]
MFERVDEGRWTYTADRERHYLHQAGETLLELHDRTLHVYRRGEDPQVTRLRAMGLVTPPVHATGSPLDGHWCVSTQVLPEVATASDERVWEVLAAYARTMATPARRDMEPGTEQERAMHAELAQVLRDQIAPT